MPKKRAPRKETKKRSFWVWLLKWTFIGGFCAIATSALVIFWYAHGLPEIKGFDTENRRPSIVFLTKDRKEIATHGHLYGETVTADKVPTYLIQALLATEDRRFFDHFGIDIQGLLRAFIKNTLSGRVVQGGSTLTQQLVKNVFLTHEKSLSRKVKELVLSLWLEQNFTKEQILSIYLNRVYLGGGAFGVDAAAQLYFGKLVGHLNLPECAVIAGLLKAPNRYARNHDKLRARAQVVLHNMLEVSYITRAQYEEAKKRVKAMTFNLKKMPSYRYFTEWVAQELEGLVDTSQSLIVTTTLDSRLQTLATHQLKRTIETHGKKRNIQQGAFVALAFDGAVRALVGGSHYFHMQYNLATQAHRQAGSSFKALLYLAALEKGFTFEDTLSDAPYKKGSWEPRNFLWKSKGQITLREGLAHSVNTVAIRLLERIGVDALVEMAGRLGLSRKPKKNLSIALGTTDVSLLEMTNIFAMIGNHGTAVKPYGVLEVRDTNGKILYKRPKMLVREVINPQIAAAMDQGLQHVVKTGSGRRARLPGRAVAGKTGTTQQYRDAWFIGYVNHLVGGVWLGNPNGSPMNKVTGGSLPTLLWKQIMTSYLRL